MLAYDLLTEGISEEKKEGILRGMELMGLQTEKWFNNEEHATAYRNDTMDECGFSGWKETVLFTRGFLDAEEPESDENEGISMIIDDGSETSDMELTDDETNEEFEIVDNEDEEDDEDEDDEDEDDEDDDDDEDEDEDDDDDDDEDEDDEDDGSPQFN